MSRIYAKQQPTTGYEFWFYDDNDELCYLQYTLNKSAATAYEHMKQIERSKRLGTLVLRY